MVGTTPNTRPAANAVGHFFLFLITVLIDLLSRLLYELATLLDVLDVLWRYFIVGNKPYEFRNADI
jgi:hypothetical protein